MPLVARLKSGKRITIFEALKFFDEETEFFCPFCNSKMHIVKAVKRTPHFRHNPYTSCGLGGESERHLELKTLAGLWLMSKGWDVDFEVKVGKSIADVLAVKDGFTVRVEVQCSSIDLYTIVHRVRETVNTFKKAGCLWLFDYAKYKLFRGLTSIPAYFVDIVNDMLVVIINNKEIPITEFRPAKVKEGFVVLDKSNVFRRVKMPDGKALCPKCLSIAEFVSYCEFDMVNMKEERYELCPVCGFRVG